MKMSEQEQPVLARSALLVLLAALLTPACKDDSSRPQTGSETHFLTRCDQSCGDGLECVCGVCTKACTETASCEEYAAAAECGPVPDRETLCPYSAVAMMCDVTCGNDADCASLGPDHHCEEGSCRAPAICLEPETQPNELAVMGDSLVELSGMVGALEEQARLDGWLGPGETLRNYSSSLNSFLANNNQFANLNQLNTALAEGPVRVLILNGGATDMLQPGCDPPSQSCAAVADAVAGAEALFERMAEGGVESVVYWFYPDFLEDAGLRARIDVLRPLIQEACANSPVRCHFVDLRSSFPDRADYFAADGIVLSPEGAAVAAERVWTEIARSCWLP
jgi:hypothetical protein